MRELEEKAYTIEIGISLGNKWFTPNTVAEQTAWALRYTKDVVVICVADTIHAINIGVRKRISRTAALRIAKADGAYLLTETKKRIEEIFDAHTQQRVVYATWSDVVDQSYRIKLERLYTLYKNDAAFKDAIHALVAEHVSKETRTFSEEDIRILGTYLIEELPSVLCRVPIKGIRCDAYTYPFDGAVPEFVEEIQMGKKFAELRAMGILDTESKVFLEVR